MQSMKNSEQKLPDKNKMYLSPSKETIMVYIEDEWQMFLRQDISTKHTEESVDAALKQIGNELKEVLPNINDTPPAYRKSEKHYFQYWLNRKLNQ